MVTFLAICPGASISSAKLIATSADARLVADFAAHWLGDASPSQDPILEVVDSGRRNALRLIRQERAVGTTG